MRRSLFIAGMSLFGLLCVSAQQESSSVEVVRHFNDAFNAVYEKVSPAVVVINVNKLVSREKQLPPGGDGPVNSDKKRQADAQMTPIMEGSGFFIDSKGYILTNAHVVEGEGERSITVRLKDGRQFPGKIIGSDWRTDVAVVKIDGENFPGVEFGDSDKVKVGQFAFTIGAPMDLPNTFSMGVVSAKGRDHLTQTPFYEDFIQTDAPLQRGSSGGPLCDIDARVIGINTLIHSANRGLGFAIPINFAQRIARELIKNGKITHAWVGIGISTLRTNEAFRDFAKDVGDGVVVESVYPGSPAMASDLRPGDIIIRVNGVALRTDTELQKHILSVKPGDTVNLGIWRRGKIQSLKIVAEKLDDPKDTANLRPKPGKSESKQETKRNITFETAGVQLQDLTSDLRKKLKVNAREGVIVTWVDPEGKAAAANIRSSDILTEVDFKQVTTKAEAEKALQLANAENGVLVLVDRHGEKSYRILK